MDAPLWRPSRQQVDRARLTAFMATVNERWKAGVCDYAGLYRWSCEELESFWLTLWDFCGVIGDRHQGPVLIDGDRMPGARFFPAARLNFAENLLRRDDDGDAMVLWGEDRVRRRMSHAELRAQVARLAQTFAASGLGKGDRVAGYLPNLPEAVIAMLATASLGAVWSSCSPDFGVTGVVERFGQIEPKILVCADGYFYKGKVHDSLGRITEILPRLPSVQHTLVVPYVSRQPQIDHLPGAVRFDHAVAEGDSAEPEFLRVSFNDPLYVLYSSGTTGKPKCIVHGVGGTLLKHLCEHQLMCDVHPGDRIFYFTTCGWMMWNWLVSALASEATLLLFDGNPFSPSASVLFDFAEQERATLFGTSAKYIDALRSLGLQPRTTHDLAPLRTITSTGSPLAPESFDYVYEEIKNDVCLQSIAGGTDIVGCFVGGNPIGPVWRGEIQARALGMAVDVFDDAGNSLRQEKGELVCTRPFPSMPVEFWNDPQGRRYRAAYFERYPGVWHHGDFVEITQHDGVVIYGRSDATLNPGGVRIGTAEIYRTVESLEEVEEALAVGQEWDGDVRVVLFVKLTDGMSLDPALGDRIRVAVRAGCSPRHVPAKVLQVTEIPRTKSGKIVELAVREIIHGREVKNIAALANPEALAQYADRPELAD